MGELIALSFQVRSFQSCKGKTFNFNVKRKVKQTILTENKAIKKKVETKKRVVVNIIFIY